MTTANREIISEQNKYDYTSKAIPKKHSYPSSALHYKSVQLDDMVFDPYDEQSDSGITRNIHNNVNVEIKQRPIVIPKRAENGETDDLAPTSKTMSLLNSNQPAIKSAADANNKQKLRLNTRGKASVIGFVVIIVSLIIVICLNAVAISSVASSVSNLETQLSASSGALNNYNKDLAGVTHPDVSNISPEYVKPDIGSNVDIVIPGVKDTASKQSPSNWFDSFCNFFTSIFGG